MTITTQQALDALRRVCLRCGHEWTQQTAKEPTVCPKCHSPYFNRPRVRVMKEGGGGK